MKSTLIVLMAALVAPMFVSVAGWADTGHVVTGEIARRLLSKSKVDQINSISQSYGDYFPETVATLPYSATFMDYIKRDTQIFDTMHYVDFPYNIHGDVEGPQPDGVNAVGAIVNIANSLIFAKSETAGIWSKAFSTLALLHFVGDMHQPLHAAALFTKQWKYLPPLGDRGGNDFYCKYTSETGMEYKQIHLLYDCVGGLYCDYMPDVVTPEYEDEIKTITDAIMDKYPLSKYKPEELYSPTMFASKKNFGNEVRRWAIESFDAAKKLYDKITPSKTEELPAEFIQELRPLLLERIAIAGYRLAHILEQTNLSKVGPKPISKEIYYIIIISFGVLSLIAAIYAIFTRRVYNNAKTEVYVNIESVNNNV